MLQSDLVIGNDGGLQHIAAALGVPTVTIFLFTNIIKNRPLGPVSYVAANDCDNRLTCQHHIELIDVCSQNGCMSVSVDKVMEKVGMALDK
jgi:ADP-heptose:LPS heptosyltransferase